MTASINPFIKQLAEAHVDLGALLDQLESDYQSLPPGVKAAFDHLKESPVQYGCHCDLGLDERPDGCVMDEGRPQDCVNAEFLIKSGKSKLDCQEWQPIKIVFAAKI